MAHILTIYVHMYVLSGQVRVGEIGCRAAHHIDEIKVFDSRYVHTYIHICQCRNIWKHTYIFMYIFISGECKMCYETVRTKMENSACSGAKFA